MLAILKAGMSMRMLDVWEKQGSVHRQFNSGSVKLHSNNDADWRCNQSEAREFSVEDGGTYSSKGSVDSTG